MGETEPPKQAMPFPWFWHRRNPHFNLHQPATCTNASEINVLSGAGRPFSTCTLPAPTCTYLHPEWDDAEKPDHPAGTLPATEGAHPRMTTLADQRIKNLRRTLAATTARGAVVYCEHLDASDALWRPQPLGEWAARKKHLAALDRELGRLGRLHDRTLESLRRAECHAHAHS